MNENCMQNKKEGMKTECSTIINEWKINALSVEVRSVVKIDLGSSKNPI